MLSLSLSLSSSLPLLKYTNTHSPSTFKLERHLVWSILPDVVDLPLDHQTWRFVICKDGNVKQVSVKVTENLKETRTTEHDGVGLSKTDTISLIIWNNYGCAGEREGGEREREREECCQTCTLCMKQKSILANNDNDLLLNKDKRLTFPCRASLHV